MEYGYCHLTQIPLRSMPDSASEMLSQLIYGERYLILAQQNDWYNVRTYFDSYEGWISGSSINKSPVPEPLHIQQELFAIHPIGEKVVITSMGSELPVALLSYEEQLCRDVCELAKRFLGVPYLWGGRTFTGIDCSGLVQIVYKSIGVQLERDASKQQKMGKALKFNDIIAGDLVFFEKNERVTHVGLALGNDEIIHAHGEVRIDKLTKKGIINSDTDLLTHAYHSAKRV